MSGGSGTEPNTVAVADEHGEWQGERQSCPQGLPRTI